MDVQLKHRMTGAAVFVSIAIILFPLLLGEGETQRQPLAVPKVAAPPPPAIEIGALTVEEVDARIQARAAASQARMPKEVRDRADYSGAPGPTLDRNRLPVGWSLQVGSFRNKANATQLLARLRDDDHRAYMHETLVLGNRHYRVYIGPMVDRQALLAIGQAVRDATGLKGTLVRYDLAQDKGQLGVP